MEAKTKSGTFLFILLDNMTTQEKAYNIFKNDIF